jgi:AcrR family transcriptional regulator
MDRGGPIVVTHASSAAGPLRRVPVQGRSLARVNRMLDACAELIDEVGYEGLTTTMLADRAQVAIGSVYQFFPDKRAIVHALTMRNMDTYVERLSARVAGAEMVNWWDAVDAALDEFIDMNRTVPGFKTLHFGDVIDRNLLDADRENDAVFAAKLGELLVQRFGLADEPVLAASLAIAVEISDALIKLAFRRDPYGDEAVLAEVRNLVRDYLFRKLNQTHS